MTIEFLRQFRLGEYAIFDFTLAFVGMYLLAPLLSRIFLKLGVVIPKSSWVLLALPIGILAHLLFQRITPMTRDFINPQAHYILKALILGLTILAVRGMKLVR